MPCYQCIWMETAGGIAHCPRTGRTIGLYSIPCPEFAPYIFNSGTCAKKSGISTGKFAQCNRGASTPKNCTLAHVGGTSTPGVAHYQGGGNDRTGP